MSQYPKQKIEEQYQKLPDALKDAILSVETANKIFEIGRTAKLTTEKVGFLAEEAGYVILGLTRPEEFVEILAERLETSTNDAREMAKEINSQIFYPLREALKAAHQVEIVDTTNNKQQTTNKIEPTVAAPKPPPPQPNAETTSAPRPVPPPTFMRPPEMERKPIPPIDLRPKPAPSPEQKFLDKFVSQKTAPPLPSPAQISKEILAGKPPAPEPIRPSAPAAPKIPPLDLRGSAPPPPKTAAGKPERMREAIFAAPIEPESGIMKQESRDGEASVHDKKVGLQKPPEEKKAPYGGYDPYRESTE